MVKVKAHNNVPTRMDAKWHGQPCLASIFNRSIHVWKCQQLMENRIKSSIWWQKKWNPFTASFIIQNFHELSEFVLHSGPVKHRAWSKGSCCPLSSYSYSPFTEFCWLWENSHFFFLSRSFWSYHLGFSSFSSSHSLKLPYLFFSFVIWFFSIRGIVPWEKKHFFLSLTRLTLMSNQHITQQAINKCAAKEGINSTPTYCEADITIPINESFFSSWMYSSLLSSSEMSFPTSMAFHSSQASEWNMKQTIVPRRAWDTVRICGGGHTFWQILYLKILFGDKYLKLFIISLNTWN